MVGQAVPVGLAGEQGLTEPAAATQIATGLVLAAHVPPLAAQVLLTKLLVPLAHE